MKPLVYYSVAVLATALSAYLWVLVIHPSKHAHREDEQAPVSASIPSNTPVLHSESLVASVPLVLKPPASIAETQVGRIDQAVQTFNQSQQRRMEDIQARAFHQQGLQPPRPLRQGEQCMAGTIVAFASVNGVPTYTQVLEQGYRATCKQ